jgi:hypothetical protein
MASRKLTWEFELLDRVSGPARKLRISLEGVDGALERVGQSSRRAEKGTESFGTRLNAVLELGKKAFEVAEGVGHIGLSIAEAAVDAASFKEETVVALGTILGSADRAGKVLKSTIALAAHLPIETEAAINATTKLALAGYSQKELAPLTIAASDVKAFNPGRGEEAMELFLRQIQEIKQVGLGARHLRALSQETNVSEAGILEHLSKLYGGASEATLKQAMSKGLIDKNAAVTAILQAVADKEGGQLGTISKKLSTTVPGLLSTLRSRKLELLMDLDESPAYGSFRGFLQNLTNALDPTSRFGRRAKESIARTFGGVFSRVFGDFSGPQGAERMEKALARVLHVLDLVGVGFQAAAGLGKGFMLELASGLGITDDLFGKDGSLDEKKIQKLVERFEDLGKQIGDVVLHILQLTRAVVDMIPSSEVASRKGLPGIFELTYDKQGRWSGVDLFLDHSKEQKASSAALGRASAQGFASGLDDDVSPVTAIERFGDQTKGAMARALDAHSPSRVFERYGRWSAQGYQQGVDSGANSARSAVDRLVQVPNARSIAPPGLPAATEINVSIQVVVDGAKPGVAAAVVSRLEHELPRVMAEAAAKLRKRGGTG